MRAGACVAAGAGRSTSNVRTGKRCARLSKPAPRRTSCLAPCRELFRDERVEMTRAHQFVVVGAGDEAPRGGPQQRVERPDAGERSKPRAAEEGLRERVDARERAEGGADLGSRAEHAHCARAGSQRRCRLGGGGTRQQPVDEGDDVSRPGRSRGQTCSSASVTGEADVTAGARERVRLACGAVRVERGAGKLDRHVDPLDRVQRRDGARRARASRVQARRRGRRTGAGSRFASNALGTAESPGAEARSERADISRRRAARRQTGNRRS